MITQHETSVLVLLDEAISALKAKTHDHGTTSGDLFCLLVMDFFRTALLSEERPLRKELISAVWEVRARTAHFYYYHDFPEIYEKILAMGIKAVNCFPEFLSEDLPSIGFRPEDWARFVATEAEQMLMNLPAHASYRRA
jgi:hypothetical protein